MTQPLPKGYSSNAYPEYSTTATHRVIADAVPVYSNFPIGDERYSPTDNSDIFYKFLQQNEDVIVLDDNLGFNGQWSEIQIIGDTTTSENNYFIYNPSTFPTLTPKAGT